ncbi:MAG: FAD-binding protein [Thermodesulfobacteriota bacterium]
MKGLDVNVIETDVLVVGGGLAGCWAALRARGIVDRVTLVDKGVVARTGTTVFCHDLLAGTPEDQRELWLKDIAEHTEYMSEQPVTEVILEEEGDRINDLVNWGVPFERDDKGDLFLSLGRGHKNGRVVLVDCRKLMEVMKVQVQAKGVKLVERVMITDLLTSDGQHPTQGRVVGAVGINTRDGQFVAFKAKEVFLSTGYIGAKLHTCYADSNTGDGQAMAFRAGAEASGLEFNFGPNFFCSYKGKFHLLTVLWPLQTQGAHIVNGQGERFLERYFPARKERRSTQGFISQAMAKEILEGRGPIFFDMRHFTPEHFQQLRRILPIRMAAFDDIGIDPSKELVPCRPVVSVLSTGGSGGIRIGLDGETNLPGLFAGGVTAQLRCCAESISGLKLAFCSVFGYRSGEAMGRLAQESASPSIDAGQLRSLKEMVMAPAERKQGIAPAELYRQLNKKRTGLEYSVVKTEATINEVLSETNRIRAEDLPRVWAEDNHHLVKANEVRNFLDCVEMAYLCSRERRESRQSHYRIDYPFRDDINWLKWVVIRKEDGEIKVRYEPIPVDSYRVRPAKRERIPSPIQFKPGQVGSST